MCGILGCIGASVDPPLASKMGAMIEHRGPDSSGEWRHGDVWLAHKRLAILDLSPSGHQPMLFGEGRYVLTYNGEIYNYLALRDELAEKGCAFRGNSDTEVILAACAVWGVRDAIRRFEGMFAFGLYDNAEKTLWLARDPMGIKPLYYAHSEQKFAFCSEMTPLLALSWVNRSVNQSALYSYFRYACVPSPLAIVEGVKKLPSGSLLKFSNGKSEIETYWSLEMKARAARQRIRPLTIDEAADELDCLLRKSVRGHMQSDVPYGAFLSGGVDSSTIVALMQAESTQPVKTFSIGFREDSHDESKHARSVAVHLRTDHHELILEASSIPDLVPRVAHFYDEPFADNSSIPTYLVSRFAREKVTVCLSGDGGDELFGGYPRYFWAKRIERMRHFLTPRGCRIFASVLKRTPAPFWNRLVDPLLDRRLSGAEGLAHRVQRLAGYLETDRHDAYAKTMSVWPSPPVLLGRHDVQSSGADAVGYPDLPWAEDMMLTDQGVYLQDDILTKVDRASMAVSLESRVPFLTHPLVEWSWGLDSSLKLANRGDRGKIVLRKVLDRYVPRALIERPKQGFGMPVGLWLRGALKDWAESLLAPSDLEASGLSADVVRNVWNEHQRGQNRQAQLWTVLMFRAWQQKIREV